MLEQGQPYPSYANGMTRREFISLFTQSIIRAQALYMGMELFFLAAETLQSRKLTINYKRIEVAEALKPKTPQALVHITDTHLSTDPLDNLSLEGFQEATTSIATTLQEIGFSAADVTIIHTGDIGSTITGRCGPATDLDTYKYGLELMLNLSDTLVLAEGNHDHNSPIRYEIWETAGQMGVQILGVEGHPQVYTATSSPFSFLGTADYTSQAEYCTPEVITAALQQLPLGKIPIVLTHNAELFTKPGGKVLLDSQLPFYAFAGHAHAGNFSARKSPLINLLREAALSRIVYNAPFLYGQYSLKDSAQLFVGAGAGNCFKQEPRIAPCEIDVYILF